MDENQLKYQRLYGYTEKQLQYKNYIVKFDFDTYHKKLVIRPCCEEEIRKSMYNIISIKEQ